MAYKGNRGRVTDMREEEGKKELLEIPTRKYNDSKFCQRPHSWSIIRLKFTIDFNV